MSLSGQYEPSPQERVAEHVRNYEQTGDVYSGPFDGQPTVILTTKGRRSGQLRKTPLVRIEHNGTYAVIASQGGAPKHPQWYLNLSAEPHIRLQDGSAVHDLVARVAEGDERAQWWARATAIWPQFDEYQANTDRHIPVVLLET